MSDELMVTCNTQSKQTQLRDTAQRRTESEKTVPRLEEKNRDTDALYV